MGSFKGLDYHMHTMDAFTHRLTQTHTQNDLSPTFHHSSLESSVTCTRSPGLEEIRQERRGEKHEKEGMIEEGAKSAARIRRKCS